MMTAHWYALHSMPMKEAILWEQLGLHGIESYFPHIPVQPTNPRARKLKPYFPRYLFGRLDLEQFNLSMLRWMPGASGVVSFGGAPSHVPDNLIDAIRKRVDEINTSGGEWRGELKPGSVVTVQEGPFKGCGAIFDARLSGRARVRVLLNLLSGSQVRLELPGRLIQPIKQ